MRFGGVCADFFPFAFCLLSLRTILTVTYGVELFKTFFKKFRDLDEKMKF